MRPLVGRLACRPAQMVGPVGVGRVVGLVVGEVWLVVHSRVSTSRAQLHAEAWLRVKEVEHHSELGVELVRGLRVEEKEVVRLWSEAVVARGEGGSCGRRWWWWWELWWRLW